MTLVRTDAPTAAPTFLRPAAAELAGPPVRFGRAGALYDLVVTVGFATPWTAALLHDLMRWLHAALGLGGAPLPVFGPVELMFTSMMGTAVTMWALARVWFPVARLIAVDTVGRIAFSTWMIFALLSGASGTVAVFLALELVWAVLQGAGLVAAWRDRRTGPTA